MRLIGCPLALLVTKCCRCLLGNRMIWFSILDCPVFLPQSFSTLLMANVLVAVIPCIVAFVTKTLSRL
jgi:hypothetical protein